MSESCQRCGSTGPMGRFCASCGTARDAAAFPPPPAFVPPATRPMPSMPPMPPMPPAPPAPRAVAYPPALALASVDVIPAPAPVPQLPAYVPGPRVDLGGQPAAAPGLAPAAAPAGRVTPRSSLTAAVVVAILAACGWFGYGHTATHELTGQLSLSASAADDLSVGDSCSGENGYDDIQPGAPMTVVDRTGKTLATAALSEGTFDGASCVFDFTFHQVPNADEYVVDLANSIRGGQTFSRDELAGDNWHIQLTLGDD